MKELTLANLDCVVVETAPNPQLSVIWLHGLGADGHDFVPIVPQLESAKRLGMRFVFPNAPVRAVTINQGMKMRAWYDIFGFDVARDQDRLGIDESVRAIQQLIEHELNESGAKQVVLAGFSQGGAIALRAGLGSSTPLAGIIALSTYLLDAASIESWLSPANAKTPLFVGHGHHDPIVPLHLGQAAVETLSGAGLHPRWETWPMAHEVCLAEIRRLDEFMAKHLRASESAEPSARHASNMNQIMGSNGS